MLDRSTKVLVERVGDGSIIKRFDKTQVPEQDKDVICPHFLELKWATGCPYDCSWCYLKGTLRFLPRRTKPYIKDFERVGLHTETFLRNANSIPEILNTGEIADSLMLENSRKSFSRFIIPMFETQKRHKVLFLTKSNKINNLLDTKSHNQVIASFSLNAEPVAKRWERRAPTVKERINAASKLNLAGYETRIRIDPMIPVNNWEKQYKKLIDQIFRKLTPERITLGSLRGLQSTINGCDDRSWVKYLLESSNWGKKIEFNTRYFMYLRIIEYLEQEYDYDRVALCKETKGIWDKLNMDYRKIRCNCIW